MMYYVIPCFSSSYDLHEDEERCENLVHTAIFVFGSKFSHSCAPNCTWSFDPQGNLLYRAIREIQKGELLSFSYVGNGRDSNYIFKAFFTSYHMI